MTRPPVITILVANIKGGCGKTTVATHLAGAFANAGRATVLADVDRQRSSLGWIGRRPAGVPAVEGLDWSKDISGLPRGAERIVIDAPAALKTKQVEALVDLADVVVLPVLPGAFDEHATRRFLGKLDEMKAIARRRKPVAVVGNRVRANTRAAERLDGFLDGVGHRVVTRIRDAQLYAEVAASGLTLFDLKGARHRDHRADWEPLLAWLDEAS